MKKASILFAFALLFSFEEPKQKVIKIELPLDGWNTVLKALSKMPYDESAPLISSIQQQASKQLQDTLKKK